MSVPTTEPVRAVTHPVARATLVCVEGFVTAGAVFGGVGLIADNAIGMLPEWLERTPFTSWLWPGVLLLLLVAVPMGIAGYAEITRRRWAFAASLIAGSAQVGWIGAQWVIMQRYFFLQPIMLACGIGVIALACWVHRTEPLWPR